MTVLVGETLLVGSPYCVVSVVSSLSQIFCGFFCWFFFYIKFVDCPDWLDAEAVFSSFVHYCFVCLISSKYFARPIHVEAIAGNTADFILRLFILKRDLSGRVTFTHGL